MAGVEIEVVVSMFKRPSVIIFVLLLVVPTLELAAVMAVGKQIGLWPTLTLLIAESLFGAWIVRREGLQAWRGLTQALASAQMPSREIADAALVLFGGALLLTPGFITDVVGFLCVLPFTRPMARALLTSALSRQVEKTATGGTGHVDASTGFVSSGFGEPGSASRGSGFSVRTVSFGPGAGGRGQDSSQTSGSNGGKSRGQSREGIIEGEVID